VDRRISEVAASRRARIDLPAPGAALPVSWVFRPRESGGSVMTQTMQPSGERAAEDEGTVGPAMGLPDGQQE
jgi:hypothetical protein